MKGTTTVIVGGTINETYHTVSHDTFDVSIMLYFSAYIFNVEITNQKRAILEPMLAET